MKFQFLFAVFPILALIFVEAQAVAPVEGLIRRLGSADYRQRETATKTLLERPDAEGKLRAAIASGDREISQRAAYIVEEFEQRRLASAFRELDEAIAEGRIERAIELIVAWPEKKVEGDLWLRIKELSTALLSRHHRLGCEMPRLLVGPLPPERLIASRFTAAAWDIRWNGNMVLRAKEVEFDCTKVKGKGYEKGGMSLAGPVIICTGPVSFHDMLLTSMTIFSNERIEVKGKFIANCVLLCAGDIDLHKSFVSNTLVIAKGSVIVGAIENSRIISGKSVTYDKANSPIRIVTENEPNPLGYVRWRPAEARRRAEK